MTRNEALAEADRLIEELLRSGDEQIFGQSRNPDGTINQGDLVAAALRARQRIADRILSGEI